MSVEVTAGGTVTVQGLSTRATHLDSQSPRSDNRSCPRQLPDAGTSAGTASIRLDSGIPGKPRWLTKHRGKIDGLGMTAKRILRNLVPVLRFHAVGPDQSHALDEK